MTPRTKAQFQSMRETSRRKIMDAALELFANQGYYPTSIDTLAKKAQVSKGLIYNYFNSKEEILEAIIILGFQEIENATVSAFEQTDQSSLLERQIDLYANLLDDKADFFKLYMHLLGQPTVIKAVHSIMTEFYNRMTLQLTQLLENSGSLSPELDARVLGAVLDGICFHYYLDPDYPIRNVINHVKGLFLKEIDHD